MNLIARPIMTILLSSLAAIMMAADEFFYHIIGIALAAIIIVLALRSSWLGLLALIPMLFSINPAPPFIGLSEGVFALLAVVTILTSLAEEIREEGWAAPARRYRWPLAIACLFCFINLYMARQNSVSLNEWLRGVTPFLFLVFAMPFAYALEGRPERLKFIGLALAAYTFLLMGHLVGYYIVGGIYKPYWLLGEGASAYKISAEQLVQYPDATGPYITRITMVLKRSTTVLMGAGMTMAFVAATLAASWQIRFVSGILAILCLTAELLTYTRSMLVVSSFTVMCFIILLALRYRRRLRRALILIAMLIAWGGATIWLFDMGSIWTYRISTAAETVGSEAAKVGQGVEKRGEQGVGQGIGQGVEQGIGQGVEQGIGQGVGQGVGQQNDEIHESTEESINSRRQEILLAWMRFKDHPLLGNGLGIKNRITYVGPDGPIEIPVAFIHNWIFYALMVGGLLGFSLFAFILSGPILSRWRQAGRDLTAYEVVRFGMLSVAIYGLTFAVFRHIDFNLLVATAWGVMLAAWTEKA